MSLARWLRLSLRRAVAAPLPTAGVIALAFVTALVFSTVPRLQEHAAQQTFAQIGANAAPDVRALQLTQVGRLAAGPETAPMARVDATAARLAEVVPASIRSAVSERYVVIDTPRFQPADPSLGSRTVTLRLQPGADRHVRFVAGVYEAPGGSEPPPPIPSPADPTGATVTAVVDASVSTATARDLGLGVGDTLHLVTDTTDRFAANRLAALSIRIVGIFEPLDTTSPYWVADRHLFGPVNRRISLVSDVADSTVLLSPKSYPALLAATESAALPLRYTWRSLTDPSRLDSSRLDVIVGDLGRLETIFQRSGSPPAGGPSAIIQFGLLGVTHDFRTSWVSVQGLLAVLAIGAGAIVLLALALVLALYAAGRRASVALWQGRGASRPQLAFQALAESAAIGWLPAAVAVGLAALAVPVEDGTPAAALGAIVGLWTTMTLVALTLRAAREQGPADTRRAAAALPSRARRLVLDGLVIAAAAAGLWLLRDRGIVPAATDPAAAQGTRSLADVAGPDLLVAAVPALAAVAAALLVVRLAPLLTRLLLRLATRTRGLVPSLALWRAARGRDSSAVLMMLLAIAAFGIFAASALATLRASAAEAAWQSVGGSLRVTGAQGYIPDTVDLRREPGVAAQALAARAQALTPTGAAIAVFAPEMTDFAAVLRGSPGETSVPAELLAPPSDGMRSGADPVPAIGSSALAAANPDAKLGAVLPILIRGTSCQVRIVAIRDSFPGMAPESFLVVSRSQVSAALGTRITATDLFLRTSVDDDAVAAAVAKQVTDPAILSERHEERTLAASPYLGIVTEAASLAVLVAALYAILAIVVVLAMAGAGRAAETAHLSTLGLRRGQVRLLTLGEHGPGVLLAFVFGALTGVAMFFATSSGLGLAALLTAPGSGTTVSSATIAAVLASPAAIGVPELGVLLAGLIITVAVATAVQAAIESSRPATAAVRQGME